MRSRKRTCADLDCEEPPTETLRYQATDGTPFEYELCAHHLDKAHHWLAERPRMAATAISQRLPEPAEQPALFD